jgi:hypothetical protein
MTKRRADKPLPPLPTARSPRELDDRILAHARSNAPRPARRPAFAWGGGLGAAAVLVLAVYLVNPDDASRSRSAPPLADNTERPAEEPAASEAQAKASAPPQAYSAAPARRAERQVVAAGAAEELALSASAAPPEAQTLDSGLAELRAMLETGQEEQARAAYADLRRRCVDCGLPARLEDALRKLPD